MASRSVALALLCLAALCCVAVAQYHPGVNSTTLPKALIVKAKINGMNITNGTSLLFLHDNLTISWKLNSSFIGLDTNFKKVLIKLCFGAASAKNRKWRKNFEDLKLSKTCKYKIAAQPYRAEGNNVTYQADRSIPHASYFVRVFVLNSTDASATPAMNAVAIGQTTNKARTASLFNVVAYEGTTDTLNILIVVFSTLSYVLLFGIYFTERMMKRSS